MACSVTTVTFRCTRKEQFDLDVMKMYNFFLEGCINLEVVFLSHFFSNAFHLGIDGFKD